MFIQTCKWNLFLKNNFLRKILKLWNDQTQTNGGEGMIVNQRKRGKRNTGWKWKRNCVNPKCFIQTHI